MKRLGRLLALICALDVTLVGLQFLRDYLYGRRPAPALTYQDCLNFMIELHSNDLLAPIAEEN